MEQNNNCPVCDSIVNPTTLSTKDTYRFDCPRCGFYEITDSALRLITSTDIETSELNVSYWIRRHQVKDSYSYIDVKIIRELLVPFEAPKPIEQVNNLLLWIGDNQKSISGGTNIFFVHLVSVVGCFNDSDVKMIVKHLEENKLIILRDSGSIGISKLIARLTISGWERYYELKKTSKDSRFVFMAMKFGNTRLAKIFNDVIKDAVSRTGFDIRRLDEEKRAGLIDDKLRVEIRRSKFLIADLTDDNNGAYWEAGFAEGLGMPVIYICEEEKFKAEKSHFDTNHHLTVQWKDDAESLKKFAEELKATIRATFPAEAKMED